jgi:tetratricopeptide (TPR) repeat protein
MKTFVFIVLGAWTLVGSQLLIAQTPNKMHTDLYKGYLQHDKKGLQKAVETMEQNKAKPHDLLEAYYLLLNSTFADQDEKLFNQFVDRAEKLAGKLVKANAKDAKAHAILSSIYGSKIAYAPMKGMFLGGKSSNHMNQALQHGKDEPLVYVLNGISKYNTPETWGGSKAEALKSFAKAVEMLECQPIEQLQSSWMFLHALAWHGIVLQNTGNAAQALKVYQRALEVAPDFQWVKQSLLPELAQKM